MRTKRAILLLAAATLALGGCEGRGTEDRAREAAEKIKESMPDVDARALAQKVPEDVVRKAQQALTAAHEYMGEVSGKLDQVTVNAIQAFQRSHGIPDNGLLDAKTIDMLNQALAKG